VAIDTPDWMRLTQLAAPVLLGTISQANGATIATGTVSAIPFQTGWLVTFANNAIAFAGSKLTIVDSVSGQPYVDATPMPGDIPAVSVPVSGLSTAVVNVSLSGLPLNSSGFAKVVAYVFGMFGAGVQAVYNSPLQPIYVKEVPDPFSGFLSGGLTVTTVISAIAISGTLTPITAVVGSTVVIYGYSFSIRAGVSATVGLYSAVMEDTTGAVILDRFDLNWATAVGTGNSVVSADIPQGVTLPAGSGLKIICSGGNPGTMQFTGRIYYTAAIL